jgi:predicted FMN-binding regulatory protein PaiB
MVGAIVAFEMTATKLEGTFKLGQNRSVEDRRRTIAALENEGSEGQSLAEFMRRRAGV